MPLRKLCVDGSVHATRTRLRIEESEDRYFKDFLIDHATADHELKKAMRPKKDGFHVQGSDYLVKSPKSGIDIAVTLRI